VNTGAARLQVLAAALLFSTGGAGIKVEAFSALQVSALRSGIAALVLLLFLRGRLAWSPQIGMAAVVYAATVTLFVVSTKLTTAANAIFLQSTAPLYLLLLGPLLLGEHFKRRDLVYLVVVALGMLGCFTGRPVATDTAPDPALGNALAVACSITWAFTLIALRYVERERLGAGVGVSAAVLGNFFASVAAMPFAWPLPTASAGEWATIVYLGVCQIAVAYVFLTSAIRHLSALEVSLLLLIEPVLNPVWTWILRGEHPGTWTIVGGGIIVAATALRAANEARATNTPVP
jgi:drug/metabolite transporter, DME family